MDAFTGYLIGNSMVNLEVTSVESFPRESVSGLISTYQRIPKLFGERLAPLEAAMLDIFGISETVRGNRATRLLADNTERFKRDTAFAHVPSCPRRVAVAID